MEVIDMSSNAFRLSRYTWWTMFLRIHKYITNASVHTPYYLQKSGNAQIKHPNPNLSQANILDKTARI
ncbi:hypothetical protein QQP08_024203 [Theobroma cacao]|nr:hypothetical protein QQP08_024203 [Theobroma cacao]